MKLRFEFTIPRCEDGSSGRSAYEQAAAALAGKIYRFRRRRSTLLGGGPSLFGEPAWDMLLDLFMARVAQKQVSVSSLCLAADVPATTALRWIAVLERERMIERYPDPTDKRRTYLRLTCAAARAMTQLLQE